MRIRLQGERWVLGGGHALWSPQSARRVETSVKGFTRRQPRPQPFFSSSSGLLAWGCCVLSWVSVAPHSGLLHQQSRRS